LLISGENENGDTAARGTRTRLRTEELARRLHEKTQALAELKTLAEAKNQK
jgi:hypothetical protein